MPTEYPTQVQTGIREHSCGNLRVNALRGFWAVPVSRSRIEPEELQPLKAVILNLAREKGVQKSNRGGWHSSTARLLEAAALSPTTSWLSAAILHAAESHVQSMVDAAGKSARSLGKIELELIDAWANINRAGHGNVVHSHPGLLSGVLYVDTGLGNETTRLCFTDPRSGLHLSLLPQMEAACQSIAGAPPRPGTSMIDLKAGDLVTFPSWLQHHVPLHQGDKPRISISFNIRATGGSATETFGIVSAAIPNHTMIPSEKFLKPPRRHKQLFETVALRFSSNHSTISSLQQRLGTLGNMIASWRSLPQEKLDVVAKSDVAGVWQCLADAFVVQMYGAASLPSGSLAIASHLSLPRGFVQTDRGLGASVAGIKVAGLQLLSGTLRLWLFDPRPMVESAAASDIIARRLFGRKVALQLDAGDIIMLPPWLEMSFDTETSDVSALSFGFGYQVAQGISSMLAVGSESCNKRREK